MNNEPTNPNLLSIISLEDSEMDFEIIREKLISAGYHFNIVRVDKEAEFTALIQNHKYDLILADYKLPAFDAFEALNLCNLYCPNVPFICVSGSVGEIMAIELLKNGAADYVLKDRLERLPFVVKRAIKDAEEKTIRQQMEISLKRNEEKYRTIFENVQDVFYQTDVNGIIKEISPSIKYFSEFEANELVGKPVYDIYANPDERKILLQTIGEGGEIRDYEIKLKTKYGDIKYASINARLICNAEGTPEHIDGAIRDITRRKLAEESLQQSESDLNDAQEIARMGSWNLDLITHKQTWSKNMYILLGLTPNEKEISHADFRNMVHPDDQYLIDIYHQEIIKTKSKVSFEFRFLIPGNGIIWIQNIVVPVYINDELVELRGVNLDITEKKKVEQELIKAKEKAEASDRLKTTFLSLISHEIRTPLTEIQGYGQILTQMNVSEKEKEEYLAIVKASSKRLINTVTSFIDMSMIASGSQTISKSECLIEFCIQRVVDSYAPICKSKNIDLLLNFPPDNKYASIFTDENLLIKIFNHLVDNAVKFTTNGSVTIGYQCTDKIYAFYIKDTGIGISDKMQQTIFDDFIQVDNSDTRPFEGSGLGLSIAAGLIKLLGGQIQVESEIGKGSTFRFSLPN